MVVILSSSTTGVLPSLVTLVHREVGFEFVREG